MGRGILWRRPIAAQLVIIGYTAYIHSTIRCKNIAEKFNVPLSFNVTGRVIDTDRIAMPIAERYWHRKFRLLKWKIRGDRGNSNAAFSPLTGIAVGRRAFLWN